MGDITSVRWLYIKGALFTILGLLASALLVAEIPSFKVFALLILAIWSFCRAYYFAFYVIQHYVDPSFRFSGLVDFFMQTAQRSHRKPGP